MITSKFLKASITIICTILLPLYLNAQPLRIGLKGGIPFVWALHAEYITPVLDSKLAGNLDFSYYPTRIGQNTYNFTYLDLGANYYFFEKKPLKVYGGLSFASVFIKSAINNSALKADISAYMSSIILKTGLTFRPLLAKFPPLILKGELGYTLLPSGNMNVSYTSGTNQTTERVNLNNIKGSLIASIGLVMALKLPSRPPKAPKKKLKLEK